MKRNIPGVYRSFKYIIDTFTVIIEDDIFPIDPKYISSLSLEKDFDNDAFPILKVDFALDDDVYYRVIDNKDKVKFKLRLMKYLYDENNKIRSKKQVLSDVFISFIDENTPQIDKKMKKGVSDPSLLVANKSLSIFLFKKDTLISSKEYINGIFNNVTILELLTYILSTTGVRNVLLSPLHNITRYDEIRIPPLTMIDALDYIENVYDGFFNKGSIKFFDLDCTYFVDKGRNNNVYRHNEITQNVISISDPTSNISKVSGCNIDNDNRKTYINIPPDAFSHNSVSILNEHISANNAIIISPTTGKITRIEPNVAEVTGNVYKLLVDRYNNSRAISSYESSSNENDTIINISFTGLDINSFTPNKQFNIIFEDVSLNTTLGGDYRLCKVNFLLKKEADEFSIIGDAKFKRIR